MKKCMTCGAPMKAKRENYRYSACGLNVVLQGVEVSRCANCGEEEVSIRRIEAVHNEIAEILVHRKERLGPSEIKYLRKYLGFSQVDFAAHIGATPETVCRWEKGVTPMNVTADRLLRMMVATKAPISDYSVEDLKNVAHGDPKPTQIGLREDRKGWTARATA